MKIVTFFLILISSQPRHLLSSQFDASWSNGGDISSPAKTVYMAAAFHYNNKIFVFGDFTNPKSLFQYDITTKQFTDFGSTALTVNIAGYSQFWTQIGNIAYIIGYYTGNTERNLYIYDLSTNNVPSLTATLTIRNNTSGGKACLASGNNMLFVVGGVDPLCSPPDPTCSINGDLKLLQIYDLLSQRWLSNGPLMRWQRDQFACIVMDDYLYAMGGFSVYDNQQWADGGLTAKIEKIQISNIYNNAWAYTQNELLIKMRKHTAVTFGDYIVVIGGESYDSGSDSYGPVDKVQLINTASDVVTFAGGTLNKAAYSTAPILIGNVLYAFGGIGASVGIDTWQYITLPSDPPTSDPTESPSSVPSRNPTKSPTKNPSVAPTFPTNNPSKSPTDNPTMNPTNGPTAPTVMTESPTTAPTGDPTITSDLHSGESTIISNAIKSFICMALLIIFAF